MSAPILITTIFVGGVVAISVLGKWARQVTEVLVLLLAAVAVMTAIMSTCGVWPNYCAHVRSTPALSAEPSGHQPRGDL